MAHAGMKTNYGDINASGNTRLHVGHNFYNAPAPDDPAKILEALFETDPESDRRRLMQIKGGRVKGTCQWILDNEKFKNWLHGDVDVLSISGGPGKGKSMLADFIISELEKQCTPRNNAALTYFFCLNAESQRNNIVSVLRGLLYALVRTCPRLSSYLKPELGNPERRSSVLSSSDILWDILISMADGEGIGTIFCILDGLDECSQDTERFLRKKLRGRTTKTKGPHRIRFAILSRPSHAFEHCALIRLDPDNNDQVSKDLCLYITDKLDELEEKFPLNTKSRQELYDQLVQRAEGTFLWVGFAVEELLRQKTIMLVKKRLKEMPPGLPALYARMLNQVPEDLKPSWRIILRWVASAIRPLWIEEMAGILNPELRGDVSDDYLSEVKDLVTECGSLVVIEESEKHNRVVGRRIVVVHQSARDYLRSLQTDDPLEYWRIDPIQSNIDLLRACVECIEGSSYQYKRPKGQYRGYWKDRQAPESPLFEYARERLILHATLVPDSHLEIFRHPFFFYNRHQARTNWFSELINQNAGEIANFCARDDCTIGQYLVACGAHAKPWIQYLLDERMRSPDLSNLEGSDGKMLLWFVARASKVGGRSRVAIALRRMVLGMLLRYGIDPNATDDHGRTVLHMSDHLELKTVECLVQSKANVEVADNHGATPLMSAIKTRGHVASRSKIQLLLKAGALNCSAMDDGSTALHIFAQATIRHWTRWRNNFGPEHVAILQLLLDHGANTKALDNLGRTPVAVLCEGLLGLIPSLKDDLEVARPYSDPDPVPWSPSQSIASTGSFLSIYSPTPNYRMSLLARLVTEETWSGLVIKSPWFPSSRRSSFWELLNLLAPHSAEYGGDKLLLDQSIWDVAFSSPYRWPRYDELLLDQHIWSSALNRRYRCLRYDRVEEPGHSACNSFCTLCSQPTGYIRHKNQEKPDEILCTSCLKAPMYAGRTFRTLGCSGQLMSDEDGWWPYCCANCHRQIYKQKYYQPSLGHFYCADCAAKIPSLDVLLEAEKLDIIEECHRIQTCPVTSLEKSSGDLEIYCSDGRDHDIEDIERKEAENVDGKKDWKRTREMERRGSQ